MQYYFKVPNKIPGGVKQGFPGSQDSFPTTCYITVHTRLEDMVWLLPGRNYRAFIRQLLS